MEAIISTLLGSFVLILVFSVLIVQTQHFSQLQRRIEGQDVVRSLALWIGDETAYIARNGVLLAQPDSFVFLQPVTMGMVCAATGSSSDVYMPQEGGLPTAEIAGYAVRGVDGEWTYTTATWSQMGTSYSTASAGRCAAAGTDTSGISGDFLPSSQNRAVGTVMMFYRRVVLSIAPSELDPDSHGVFAGGSGQDRREVGSFLLSSSHFEYHRQDLDTYQSTVPSGSEKWVDKVLLVLEAKPSGDGQPESLTVPLPFFNGTF